MATTFEYSMLWGKTETLARGTLPATYFAVRGRL